MERRRCLPLALGDWGSVLAKVRETNDEGETNMAPFMPFRVILVIE
jgi:hypothetical protein